MVTLTKRQLENISKDPMKYLNQAFDIEASITVKLARIEALRALAESVTAKISLVPGSGSGRTSDKVANGVMCIREVEEDIGDELKAMSRKQVEIAGVIQCFVKDEKHRSILEIRYLALSPWDEIAEKLGCTRRWAMTLHERALKELIANCLLKIAESA